MTLFNSLRPLGRSESQKKPQDRNGGTCTLMLECQLPFQNQYVIQGMGGRRSVAEDATDAVFVVPLRANAPQFSFDIGRENTLVARAAPGRPLSSRSNIHVCMRLPWTISFCRFPGPVCVYLLFVLFFFLDLFTYLQFLFICLYGLTICLYFCLHICVTVCIYINISSYFLHMSHNPCSETFRCLKSFGAAAFSLRLHLPATYRGTAAACHSSAYQS